MIVLLTSLMSEGDGRSSLLSGISQIDVVEVVC